MTEPASTSKALIALDRISKVFQMGDTEVRALDDVSLSVSGGEFWAIMGASGSGKSTMLNLIGCLDRATSGRYVLDGRDISGLNDDELSEVRLRHMGFIFQSFNLIPQLTVERNIELPLYYLGWDAEQSRAKARELAAQVGLADRLRHRPTELSGGQQQRVAIARARQQPFRGARRRTDGQPRHANGRTDHEPAAGSQPAGEDDHHGDARA